MNLRRDALAAAAEMVLAVEQAATTTPGIVATVGRMEALPGAVNVIPSGAKLSLLGNYLEGIKSTVFMPEGAPIPKEKATRGYGAEVRFHGHSVDDALVEAKKFAAETGAVLIHPFDHVDIVTGQGTCGLEILDQCPDVRTVLVSTGAVLGLAVAAIFGIQALTGTELSGGTGTIQRTVTGSESVSVRSDVAPAPVEDPAAGTGEVAPAEGTVPTAEVTYTVSTQVTGQGTISPAR